MKKFTLKNIAILLAASIIFTLSSTAYAESTDELVCFCNVLTEEQIIEKQNVKGILDSFVQDEYLKRNSEDEAVEDMYDAIEEKKKILARNLTYPSSYTAFVAWQGQKTGSYCGPATASMLLSCTNYSADQDQIAAYIYNTATHTTGWTNSSNQNNMATGLNTWQSNWSYNHVPQWNYSGHNKSTTSQNDLWDGMKFTIYMDYGTAISGCSQISGNSHMPNYPTTDSVYHWVVCNGWTANNEYIITDPASGKYYVDSGIVYDFTSVQQTYSVTSTKLYAFINYGVVY